MVLSRSVPAGALVALALAVPAQAEEERREPRVVVADGEAAELRVFTLAGAPRGGRIALPADDPAYLTALPDGRHVAAVQHEGGAVSVLDGGSWLEPHGDHHHAHVARPRLTPFRLEVASPSHVVAHGGDVAVFADGSGTAHLFGAGDLRRADAAGRALPTGEPHHGVAVPFGDRVLTSAADPAAEDGALPDGVSVRDASGTELQRLGECPELHGEAAGPSWVAFACADGVLLATRSGGTITARKLAYPPADDPEARAFTLRSSGRHLVGDFGARALVRIDRESGAAKRLSLPARLGGFAVAAGAAVALTADGRIRRIDIRTGAQRRVARAVRRFDPETSGPRPAIAAGAGHVVVSDPARRRVRVLRDRSLRHRATFRVAGAPQRLAVVGTPPH